MSKEDIREQLTFADKAIRELKKQRYELLELGKPVDEITTEIDKLISKVMDLSLQYTKTG